MAITASELKANLGKYLDLAMKEDIYITKNGKLIAKLSTPFEDRQATVDSLYGILSDEISLEESKEDRLNQI